MNGSLFTFGSERGWSMDPLPAMDSPQTLVVVFSAPEYYDDPAPLNQLASAFPNSHLIGCSTAGEIFGAQMQDLSLAVVVVQFEQTRVRSAFSGASSSADSFQAGQSVARQLREPDLRGVFVLSEGNHINGSELACGIISVLPTTIVTGGLAGDGDRFQRTWVFCQGGPQIDHDGAAGAAVEASQSVPAADSIVSIAVSYVGRRLVLGDRIEEELEAALANLPSQTLQIGVYSYGEISPTGGYCDLHNQTMTITTLSEKSIETPVR